MKGIELSVNFLVVLILGIAILGGGIMMMYQVFNASIKMNDKLTQQNQDDLNRLMSQGQLVACPLSETTIPKGNSAIIPLGILNKAGMNVRYTVVVDDTIPNPAGVTFHAAGGTLSFISGPYDLENNKDQMLGVGIGVPRTVSGGTYILGITVTCNETSICLPPSNIYDSPRRVLVVVK